MAIIVDLAGKPYSVDIDTQFVMPEPPNDQVWLALLALAREKAGYPKTSTKRIVTSEPPKHKSSGTSHSNFS